MSDTDDVKLRDHIEKTVALQFETIRSVMQERQRALELLADNIKTHLEHLNGVQAQTVKDRDEFLLISVYKEMHRAIEDRVNKIEETLNDKIEKMMVDQIVPVKNTQARLAGMGVILIILAGIIGSVVTHVFFK